MSRPPKPVKYVKKPNVLEVGGSDGRSGELADGPRSISQLRPRRSVSKTRTSTPPASSLYKSKIAGKRSRKNCGGPGRKRADEDVSWAPGSSLRRPGRQWWDVSSGTSYQRLRSPMRSRIFQRRLLGVSVRVRDSVATA